MSFQSGKPRGRLALAFVSLWSAFACASLLAGCLGSGDDSSPLVSVPKDGGDARTGDAMGSDAETASGDARADARAGDVGDAGVQDGSDAGAANPPVALLSATGIDFGMVGC